MPPYSADAGKGYLKNGFILLDQFCARVTSKPWDVSISQFERMRPKAGIRIFMSEKDAAVC